MSRLVQRQTVDKNGHLTTRWVRDNGYTSSQTILVPKVAEPTGDKLPRGAVKEMREIKAAVMERLGKDYEKVQVGYRYGTDENYKRAVVLLKEALLNKEYDKMKVYEKHLKLDSLRDPEHLSNMIDMLRSVTHEDVAEKVTDEFMEDFWRLNQKLKRSTLGGPPEAIRGLSKEEVFDAVDFAAEIMFNNPGCGDKVYSLIVDRGIVDYDSLADAVEESKNIKGAIFGGML